MMLQIGGDWFNSVFWFFLFMLLAILYPKMLLSQMLFRLGKTASLLDSLTAKGKEIIEKKIEGKSLSDVRKKIDSFLDFFVIEPVKLDPFGIVKKYEHLLELEDRRLKYFVDQIAGGLDEEKKANLISGITAEISLHQITKIIKHYIELIRKTKSYQLGLLIQMQLPLIEKSSKALFKGVEALSNGWPIGDSVGPLVAAKLMKGRIKELKDAEHVLCSRILEGKRVYIMKAKGPGARVGKIRKAIEHVVKQYKIAKIITVDAALKLESEKTGTIAEGIGVAMGGIGVDKAYIEDVAVKNGIPLDSYIIKMSEEEAIMPMKKEILDAVDTVIEKIKENIRNSKGNILVIGVGNTVGIPNDNSKLDEVEKLILSNDRKLKEWLEKEKKQEESEFLPLGI